MAVVTGTRAEYGLLQSVMQAVDAHPRLALRVVVCGMHLVHKFGYTLRDVERDGWTIAARIPMQRGDDTPGDQARGLARGVEGIARYLIRGGIDAVVVLGDRIEAMAAAVAALTTGRLLAHVHGGDAAPGDFDNRLRNAISKMTDVHLVASTAAAQRLRRMGEPPERIVVVGAPGLDHLLRDVGRHKVPKSDRTALIVHHAHGRAAETEYQTMRRLLRAVENAGLKRFIVHPNSDRGHSGILRAIVEHVRASRGDAWTVPSLPRSEYLQALAGATILVGNSSSGIIEAPAAGTPVVNVGSRQAGRDLGGTAIVHCAETVPAIREAIGRALRKGNIRPTRRYGDGRAGERIAEVLASWRLGCKVQ